MVWVFSFSSIPTIIYDSISPPLFLLLLTLTVLTGAVPGAVSEGDATFEWILELERQGVGESWLHHKLTQ